MTLFDNAPETQRERLPMGAYLDVIANANSEQLEDIMKTKTFVEMVEMFDKIEGQGRLDNPAKNNTIGENDGAAALMPPH